MIIRPIRRNKYHPIIRACLFALAITSLSFSQPNFQMTGFATQNGGTAGGKGGKTVTATSYSQLKSHAESSTSLIIMVEGKISNGSAGGRIGVRSNKSIIGVGSSAFLEGVGINISSQKNIIIQNLKITLVGTSNPGGVNGGDCISITGSSKNIWIDHCEIYSEDPDKQTNIDKYDGLLDIRGQSGFITVSWCYFHDHHKGCLVGASDTDLYSDRKITYHHNYFRKVKLRMPMYRGSTGHFFNNYIVGARDATEIRMNTCVRVERNYYEALHYSIYTPTDARGKTERIENIEVSRTNRAYPENCVAGIPYNYSAVLITNTQDVKTIIPQYAGVGQINSSTAKYSITCSVAQGQGTVTPASGSFESGQGVTVTATPAQGWLFDRWSGDLSGSVNPATVSMTGNKTISANFTVENSTLVLIREEKQTALISVYNLGKNALRIRVPASGQLDIDMYTLCGEKVLSRKVEGVMSTGIVEIPLHDLSKRMYLVNITYNGTMLITELINLLW